MNLRGDAAKDYFCPMMVIETPNPVRGAAPSGCHVRGALSDKT